MPRIKREFSIGTRLAVLVIAAMLPFVAFTSVLLLSYAKGEEAKIEETVTAQVRALAADIGRELDNMLRAATLLAATSGRLHAGDLEGFHQQAREAAHIQGIRIVLTDESGQQLVNTAEQFGEILPKIQRAIQLTEIIAVGKPRVSDLVEAAELQGRFIAVDVPVLGAKGGPYLLVAMVDAERFQQIVRDRLLPVGALAGVVDTQGVLIARSPHPEQFVGKRASATFLAGATGTGASFRNTSLEGISVFNSYVRLPSSGWLVSVAIPEPTLQAPLNRSLLLISVSGMGVLLIAAVTALWAGRRVAEPIATLSRSALAIGQGERPSEVAAGVREVSAVSESLQTAYTLLQENEAARSAAEHRLRSLAAIVEHSDDAIISTRLDGTVTSWNRAAERIFGYTAGEMTGHSILSIAVSGHGDDMLEILGRIRRGERVDHYETVRQRKDGATVQVSLSVSPIYDADGQLIGASKVARDITAAKLAEAALKRSQAQLQELNAELLHLSRLSEMGQMAAMVAHELNQPLTAISNYMDGATAVLRRGGDVPLPRIIEALEHAGEQALRAGQIIQRLRALASRGDGEKRTEPISPLVKEAVELAVVGSKIEGVSITIEDHARGAAVFADKIQIQQVLLNLLRNAAEAAAAVERPRIVVRTETDESKVRISVIDNGTGLPEKVRERLFQPFVSTKKTGMGIGLSVCQAIIAAHGGRLWAEPNPAGGTIFFISLSRADRA